MLLSPPDRAELDHAYREVRGLHAEAFGWDPPDVPGLEKLGARSAEPPANYKPACSPRANGSFGRPVSRSMSELLRPRYSHRSQPMPLLRQ